MPRSTVDVETLQAALLGYQHELTLIERKMAEIRSRLGGKRTALPVNPAASAGPRRAGRRLLSPEARERIAAAQRKRWAAYAKQKAASQKKAPAKTSARKAPAKAGKRPTAKRPRKTAAPPVQPPAQPTE